MSLFIRELLRAAPPCPLWPRVPDVDSIFIFSPLSDVGTRVSILTPVMRDLKAVNVLRMWKEKRNAAGAAMSPVYFINE